MTRPRSGLASLERALRAPEPGSHNLGQHLAEHGEYLAPLLGVEPGDLQALVALPDEDVAPRLKELFRRREEQRASRWAAAMHECSLDAAQRLAGAATWHHGAAMLDVSVLLGGLLADPSRTHIALVSDAFRVNMPRQKLVEVGKVLLKQYTDLIAWADDSGLHFRWKRCRGGLNLFSQAIPARDSAHVLHVVIPRPAEEKPQPSTQQRSTRGLRNARRGGSWLGDILSELGFLQ
jgi:hypothetical protein